MTLKIDIIDYKKLNKTKEMDKLITSLRDTGFAVIVNHNISEELVTKTYNIWLQAFKNESYKSKYLYDKNLQSGYFPFKSENAKNSPHKDLKEFWHIFGNRYLDCPEELQLTTREYFKAAENLGLDLLDIIEGRTPMENNNNDLWAKFALGSKSTLLRVLHYPPIENALEGEIRAAEHEDINLITVLPFAEGLEVKDNYGNWHKVVSDDPNAIVINVGDMLQELTNGYYKSTTHRVVNPEDATKSRYSLPLFIHPPENYVLSDRYTGKEFLDQRLKEIGLKK